MQTGSETELYPAVKAWFEALGYEVKAEIGPADVMALRAGEEPVLIELKRGFSLTLLQQAVARQSVSERVYVAVPRWQGRAGWRAFRGNLALCRRLGVGVLSVRVADSVVEEHCAPQVVAPRRSVKRRRKLIEEFTARTGDPNTGGTRGPVETAYKQDARACAAYLATNGPSSGADIARETGVARATRIMADNHSGWFFRVARGVYTLSDSGAAETDANATRAIPDT
ncbi:MAG: DUF2161 family putative PD-(D/E)XK-type phosphodiesterase [Pseudomonadota bacterium]